MVPSGVTAISTGFPPTGTVVATVFVTVLITETEFAPLLVTKILVLSGVTAISAGLLPTATVAITVCVAVAITETEFAPALVT